VELPGRHVAVLLFLRFRVRTRLALDVDRHHRRRRLADRARLALKRDTVDALAIEIERYADVIAAQRVVAFRMVARVFERAVIAWLPVVVEYDLLIKFGEIAGHANRP
jgi:hypothetical protein